MELNEKEASSKERNDSHYALKVKQPDLAKADKVTAEEFKKQFSVFLVRFDLEWEFEVEEGK